ncbi:MAG TPA: CDP-diacylglycerol diphosphatase, partial [Rhodopila sp.]|nr:CDP-diacylglycerol diphosphatase [Rhodopila sp.]
MRRLWLWPRLTLGLALGLAVAGLAIGPGPVRADPMALWNIVNGQCAPDEQQRHDPAPCSAVDLPHGYAVLKDLVGAAQFLLIPTARISGIEDPAVLAPDAVNYFAEAWEARAYTAERLGAPQARDVIILAINSEYGRTQNQFHIHIDCIRPDVRAALAANLDKVGPTWAPFPVTLAGSPYRAIRIGQETLGDVNPFRVLADGVPGARQAMG